MNSLENITSCLSERPSTARELIVLSPASNALPSFGKQLDRLLKTKRVRNKALADRAGITPNLIAQYRRGKSSCSPERAFQLAQFLNCTGDERHALCQAAALTTKDPVGASVGALLLAQGIEREARGPVEQFSRIQQSGNGNGDVLCHYHTDYPTRSHQLG